MPGTERLSGMLRVLPDLGFAVPFLRAWTDPGGFGQEHALELSIVLLMELFTLQIAPGLHAMGLRRADGSPVIPLPSVVGVLAFLAMVVGTFSVLLAGSLWPFVGFWILVGNRFLNYRFGGTRPMTRRAALFWGLSVAYFLGAVLLAALLPGDSASLPGNPSRFWLVEPWRVGLAGTLYFGGMGLGGLFSTLVPLRSSGSSSA